MELLKLYAIYVILSTKVGGKMKKVIGWFLTIVITLLGVSSISTYFVSKGEVSPALERGNTSNNITNDGIAVQKGDWVYYTNIFGKHRLCKIKSDGTRLLKKYHFIKNHALQPALFCCNFAKNMLFSAASMEPKELNCVMIIAILLM